MRWADEGVAVNPNGRFRRMSVANGFKIVDWEASPDFSRAARDGVKNPA